MTSYSRSCYYIHTVKKITDEELANIVKQCFFTGWQTGLAIMQEANKEDFKMTQQEVEQATAQQIQALIEIVKLEYKETIITS